MGILVFACAFLTGAVGAATYRAVGHGGHVEIAPAAIAHARAAHRPKREVRPTPPPPAPPATASAPAPFLYGVHEPKTLLSRARELQSLGLDVSVVDVQMGKTFTEWPDRFDFWPTASVPLYGRDHHLDGLEVHGIPERSPLRVAGLVDGDQLLAIDGYPLADDEMKIDPNVIRHRGAMIVEIARGDHHVVLSIHWPVR